MIREYLTKRLSSLVAKLLLRAEPELLASVFALQKKNYWKSYYNYLRETYCLPDEFKFNGEGIQIFGKGKIVCGVQSYIGSFSSVQVSENTKVIIGSYCSISHNVRIYTGSNVADQDFLHGSVKKKKYGDVIIGNGVWIGANVFITPGVVIGDNVVIGANAVITRDLPANSICGGVPARIIKMKTYLSH